ncbi:MAG: uroporphyrinogen-III synthase [Saprospiraceae bacterium]|nr:uroporphyrinogen-III synthase [Saprospiraceae bacterium]
METTTLIKKDVRSILISQPEPENGKSPFTSLAEKYNIKLDFRPFIEVVGIDNKAFRKQRINILEHSAIIFTSRNAIVYFFQICEEMRITMPAEMKYFCKSEAIALYLQKFIQYRKRKVFFGNGKMDDFFNLLKKHKKDLKFLLPSSDVAQGLISNFLGENEFDYNKAIFYRTVASDLSDLENIFYDMIVFFSPSGLKSLYENFPGFQQNETRIAAFGNSTAEAVAEQGLRLDVKAPVPGAPSMTMAIEQYIKLVRKK